MQLFEWLHQRHVVLKLRRFGPVQRVLKALDVPIWRRPSGARQRARMRLLSHAGYHLTSKEVHEPEIASLIVAVVKALPITTYLDVGANFGYYTWILRDMTERPMQLHMFEPDPGNLDLIDATLRRSPSTNVHVHRVALGEQDGRMTFYRDPLTAHRGSLVPQGFLGEEVTVDARRLDSELALAPDAAGLSPMVLAKVDIEGGEEGMLAGAPDFLAAKPVLIVECYCYLPDTAPAMLAALPGYRVLDAMTLKPTTPASNHFLALPDTVDDAGVQRIIAERDRILHMSGRRWAG